MFDGASLAVSEATAAPSLDHPGPRRSASTRSSIEVKRSSASAAATAWGSNAPNSTDAMSSSMGTSQAIVATVRDVASNRVGVGTTSVRVE